MALASAALGSLANSGVQESQQRKTGLPSTTFLIGTAMPRCSSLIGQTFWASAAARSGSGSLLISAISSGLSWTAAALGSSFFGSSAAFPASLSLALSMFGG